MPELTFSLGRYDCLCPLGRGGMAEVWAAKSRGARGFQKLVALKMLLPAMLDDPSCERMFLDEAMLASRIRHHNAIEVLDLGEEGGRLFIAMEYIDGGSLAALSRISGLPLPLPVAIEIVSAACRGLHAAHDLRDEHGALLGIVHRDVSPHNVLLGRDGAVKVADFGIAKAMAKSTGTDLGIVRGKPAYMAPEQARGERLDRRADVFALGVVLYELTTGKHPFRGASVAETAERLLRGQWLKPSAVAAPGYPPALEQLVLAAMAPSPSERPTTALELGAALQALSHATLGEAPPNAVANLVQTHLGEELKRRDATLRAAQAGQQLAQQTPPSAQPIQHEAATLTEALAEGTIAPAVTSPHPGSGMTSDRWPMALKRGALPQRMKRAAAGIAVVALGASLAWVLRNQDVASSSLSSVAATPAVTKPPRAALATVPFPSAAAEQPTDSVHTVAPAAIPQPSVREPTNKRPRTGPKPGVPRASTAAHPTPAGVPVRDPGF